MDNELTDNELETLDIDEQWEAELHLFSGTLSRDEIPDEYKWRLSDIYESDDAWQDAYDAVRARLPKFEEYHGRLGDSPDVLLDFLRFADDAYDELDKLGKYASLKHYEDLSIGVYITMKQKAGELYSDVFYALIPLIRELNSIGIERLNAWMDAPGADSALKEYKTNLDFIAKLEIDEPESTSKEKYISVTTLQKVRSAIEEAYSSLVDVDIYFPSVDEDDDDLDGETKARLLDLQHSKDRDVRRMAFEALWGTYEQFIGTISALFYAKLQCEHGLAEISRCDSVLEWALVNDDVPVSVFTSLVDTVEENVAPLHRYYSLRHKNLDQGDELHCYDLGVSLVHKPCARYTWEDAKEIVMKALAPLEMEYAQKVRAAFDGGWIDVLSHRNKRSEDGTINCSCVHPYILLNYQGGLGSVLKLAHELGHAMHFAFSKAVRDDIDYLTKLHLSIETPSTLNEILLFEWLLQNAASKDEKLYYLDAILSISARYIFDHVLVASFEHTAHERYSHGADVSADALCAIYNNLKQIYLGDNVVVDELAGYEWASISHFFYRPFNTYQYAVGYIAAASIVDSIFSDGKPAVDRYIEFLSSGESDTSIELLRRAGVDMMTPEPTERAIRWFEKKVDELERLLKE